MLLVDNLNNLFRICRVDIPIQAVTVKLGQGWLKWTLGTTMDSDGTELFMHMIDDYSSVVQRSRYNQS